MATIRIKDITTDADSKLVSGDKIVIDSASTGTRSIDYDDLKHIFNGENPDVFDGTDTDYSSVIQEYIDEGRSVRLPRGTIRIDTALSANNTYGLFIEGAGEGRTILDTTYAGGFSYNNNSVIYAAGSAEQIEDLASSPVENSKELTFSSAPDLSANDLICIWDDTDFSYSRFRPVYKDGQFFTVTRVDGTTIEVAESIRNSYPTSSNIYKVTPVSVTVKDLTIQCVSGDDSSIGVTASFGRNVRINDISVYSNGEKGVSIDRCHGFTVDNVFCKENAVDSNDTGTDYGLAVLNSSNGQVNGGVYKATRHAITVGGGGNICSVPNRNLSFSDLYCSTLSTGTFAADAHGNCENITYNNVTFDGGVSFGGANCKVTNSTILGGLSGDANQIPVYFTELVDCNHVIRDNVLFSESINTNRGAFIDVAGDDTTTLSAQTMSGGRFRFTGNRFVWKGENLLIDAIYCYNRGLTAEPGLEVFVDNNELILEDDTKKIAQFFRFNTVSSVSGVDVSKVPIISVTNNKSASNSIFIDGETSNRNYVGTLIHKNNYYYNGGKDRLMKTNAIADFIVSQGNVYDTMWRGGYIGGEASGGRTATVFIKDEIYRNAFTIGNDSGSDSAILRILHCENVVARNIDIFNDNEKFDISNLSKTDHDFLTSTIASDVAVTLTGSTATAVITSYVSGGVVDNVFVGLSRSGDFTLSETLSFTNTDAPSTVTMTLEGLPEPAHQNTLFGGSLSSFRYSNIYDSSISGVGGRDVNYSIVGTVCADS